MICLTTGPIGPSPEAVRERERMWEGKEKREGMLNTQLCKEAGILYTLHVQCCG